MIHPKWLLIIVGVPLIALGSTEYLINTVPAAAPLKLKSIPGMVALVLFLFLYTSYAIAERPKLLPAAITLTIGLALLIFIGINLWIIVGCSTGPVCI